MAEQSKQIMAQEARIDIATRDMENKLQQLLESCATERIDNCENLQGEISVLSTTVRDLEQKLHSRTNGMIEDPSERLLDVMEERLGGFSAHMQNSLKRLSMSCAEVRDHDGIVLNGRVNDLSKQLRHLEYFYTTCLLHM
jgi:polyhydroxyalkanoate synthesis regulator phasin